MVQSSPESMTTRLIPSISSYVRARSVLMRVCQVGLSCGSSTLGVPLPT